MLTFAKSQVGLAVQYEDLRNLGNAVHFSLHGSSSSAARAALAPYYLKPNSTIISILELGSIELLAYTYDGFQPHVGVVGVH